MKLLGCNLLYLSHFHSRISASNYGAACTSGAFYDVSMAWEAQSINNGYPTQWGMIPSNPANPCASEYWYWTPSCIQCGDVLTWNFGWYDQGAGSGAQLLANCTGTNPTLVFHQNDTHRSIC